jgi:glutaryl-CoA dehydrogenase
MELHYSIGEALGTDHFGPREPFTPQQESYLVRTREFVDAEVLPVINGYGERAEFPWGLEKIGAFALTEPEHGTETIQSLIVGRGITGIGAFS